MDLSSRKGWSARIFADGEPLWADVRDISVDRVSLVLASDVAEAPAVGQRVVVHLQSGGHKQVRPAVVESVEDGHDTRLLYLQIEPATRYEPETHVLDFASVKVNTACALRLPAAMIHGRKLLPFAELDGEIQVASLAGRDNPGALACERLLRQAVRFWPVESPLIDEAARAIFGDTHQVPKSLEELSYSDQIMQAAYLRQASDIHIDPGESRLVVRFRVDGALEPFEAYPMSVASEIINRFKVMGRLDIAERRAPQDGQFTYERSAGSLAVDVRVSSIPTKHGERLTLRLLAMQTGALTLEKLGFSEMHHRALRNFLSRNQGLMLMTGPTGSGKTTTLYAAIRLLSSERRLNIMTIEDPIEYRMEGVSQTEVDTAEKVSFATALRSILRHDPDVVMIGEIRDEETARIAMKAAMTGHMVLGTLHTNSAAAAITRLKDMGVDAYLVAATLRIVVAQRLSRQLCSHCRIPRALTPGEALSLGIPGQAGRTVYEPGGCVYCAGSGYRGRVGIYELLEMNPAWAREVAMGVDEGVLVGHMHESGTPLLSEDALGKLFAGVIHIVDALQITASW